MKRYIIFLIIFCISSSSSARLVRSYTYDELKESSDLVVIATPTKVNQLSERTALPNMSTVIGSGVETTFTVFSVLKGDNKLKSFILHHYSVSGFLINGPSLVSFNVQNKKTYILFLKRSVGGRYVAVSGQTDPINSIKALSDINESN